MLLFFVGKKDTPFKGRRFLASGRQSMYLIYPFLHIEKFYLEIPTTYKICFLMPCLTFEVAFQTYSEICFQLKKMLI